MKKTTLLVLVFLVTAARSQDNWLHDEFRRTDPGAGWTMTSGSWKISQDGLQITTTDYDQLLASSCYVYGSAPFTIEVTLRGIRSGIFFNLESRDSKTLSHMVRFDEKSILTGFMNAAGEYTATNAFDVDKMPSEWTVLRIDVDPQKKRYEVFVDGKSVGVDDHLVFGSGYVGLQASDGRSEFRSVEVRGTGKNLPPARSSKGEAVHFQHVGYVQSRGDSVVIYNPVEGTLQTLDQDGRLVELSILKRKPVSPQEVMAGENHYVIDGKRILIKSETGTTIDSITERLVAPSCLLTDYATVQGRTPSLFVADPGANAVYAFALDGRYLTSFSAASIGGLIAPRGMDFHGNDQIVIADYNRLVFVGRDLEDIHPIAQAESPTRVTVKWQRASKQPPFLELSTDGKSWETIPAHDSGPLNTVTIGGLSPLSRYSFKPHPLLRLMPADAGGEKEFRFSTPPSDSTMMAYTRLRVLCMVYRTMSYRDVYPKATYPQIPDGRTISDEELQYLRDACRFNTEFYFRNSSCKVVLDFDFFVVRDTLWLHELGDKDPYWLSCNERVTHDYENAVQHFGRKPSDYAGLVCPYAWMNYPPRRTSALRDPSRTDSINIRQAYGGGTNGVPAPWKYGKTTGYTGNPFQDKFSRQDWLITHEFHHQIDALMDASGYPEYYHADQPWKMPGRFGEDFDFNAHIIRNAGLDWWLNLKFGTLAETRDSDHDGVPDDDPSLPFDEKRLHGNPARLDTDGDGLNDLLEVTAGDEHGCTLNNPDTDGDGIPDGIDPEPLYAIKPEIPEGPLLKPFATLASGEMKTAIACSWVPEQLQFSFAPEQGGHRPDRFNILLQIDGENDGWFHGFDNWQIRVACHPDSVTVIDYYLRDCSSWTDPPRDRKDILPAGELIAAPVNTHSFDSSYHGPLHGLHIAIPAGNHYGLTLFRGKKMGIRIGIQTTDDRWVWNELFERNYMMQVELK